VKLFPVHRKHVNIEKNSSVVTDTDLEQMTEIAAVYFPIPGIMKNLIKHHIQHANSENVIVLY